MQNGQETINLFTYNESTLDKYIEDFSNLGFKCRVWGSEIQGGTVLKTPQEDRLAVSEVPISLFILDGEREKLFKLWTYSLFFPGINICNGYACQEMFNWAVQASKVEVLNESNFKLSEEVGPPINYLNFFYYSKSQRHSYLWLNAVDSYVDQPPKLYMTKKLFDHFRERKIDLIKERFLRRSENL